MKRIVALWGLAGLVAAALVLAPSPSYSASKSRSPAVSAPSSVAKPPGAAGQVSRPGKGGIAAPPPLGKGTASPASRPGERHWRPPRGFEVRCHFDRATGRRNCYLVRTHRY